MKSIDNMNVVPKYWDSFLNTLNVYIDTTSVSLVSVFQTFIISLSDVMRFIKFSTNVLSSLIALCLF